MAEYLVYLGIRASEIIGNIDVVAIGQNIANAAALAVDSVQYEIDHYNSYVERVARNEHRLVRELEEEPIDLSDPNN